MTTINTTHDSFQASAKAIKAGSAAALGLREGSARYVLVSRALKTKKPVSREVLEKSLGTEFNQAVRNCMFRGLIKIAR